MTTKKIATCILLSLLLITIGYCFVLGQTENKPNLIQEQNIIVKTNKSIYMRGEDIELTLMNNFKESIYSIAASLTPEFAIENIEKQQSNGMWQVNAVRCEHPECDIDFDIPVEIKPNASVTFIWKPVIHIKGEGIKNRPADPGVYRISVAYQIRKGNISENWKWITVKTNDFIIK